MSVKRKGVILVAGGLRNRAHPVVRPAPSLQPVANRPIVLHVLDALRRAGVDEMIAVVPEALADDLRACIAPELPREVALRYVVHEDGGDASDALRSAAEHVGSAACIVHRGDGLLAQPIAPFAEQLDQTATDLTLLAQRAVGKAEGRGSSGGRVLRIVDVDAPRASLRIAGICLLRPGALCRAGEAKWPAGTELNVAELGDAMERAGGSVDVRLVRGWRHHSGDFIDLLELNRATLDALSPEYEQADDGDNKIEGRVAIHETASVTSSVIVGPAIIGESARVADAYVGPYTSIGAGATIEGAEVERSIISPGASITHLGGRLVASVVGTNARIYRDFSLPRAMRLRCGDDVEVALC